MATVEIFVGPRCRYCEQAKSFLTQKDIDFVEYDISQDDHMKMFIERLPRHKAIPQIFINGEHIGNLEDLIILDDSGHLGKMIHS